jgi:hypothetical protein
MNAKAESKYNGWTNFATWRVMLEVFDGMGPEDIANAVEAQDFAELVIEHVFEDPSTRTGGGAIVEGWARAFLADVNWDEIYSAIRWGFDSGD